MTFNGPVGQDKSSFYFLKWLLVPPPLLDKVEKSDLHHQVLHTFGSDQTCDIFKLKFFLPQDDLLYCDASDPLPTNRVTFLNSAWVPIPSRMVTNPGRHHVDLPIQVCILRCGRIFEYRIVAAAGNVTGRGLQLRNQQPDLHRHFSDLQSRFFEQGRCSGR